MHQQCFIESLDIFSFLASLRKGVFRVFGLFVCFHFFSFWTQWKLVVPVLIIATLLLVRLPGSVTRWAIAVTLDALCCRSGLPGEGRLCTYCHNIPAAATWTCRSVFTLCKRRTWTKIRRICGDSSSYRGLHTDNEPTGTHSFFSPCATTHWHKSWFFLWRWWMNEWWCVF